MKAHVSTLGGLALAALLGWTCQACGGSKDHFNRQNGVGGVDSDDDGTGGNGGVGPIPSSNTGGVGTGGAGTPGDGTNSPGTPGTGATGTGGVPGTGTPGSGTPGTGATGTGTGTNGTGAAAAPLRQAGDPAAGREVFHDETFGNEAFWTDALRLPAGLARVSPRRLLALGLSVDVDALDPATRADFAAGASSERLDDPSTTPRLLAANAVIGLPARGARTGVSCALCHATTDASLLGLPGRGSIGHRRDGPANALDFGGLVALGDDSRAYAPALGDAPPATASEAEVDALLVRSGLYPRRPGGGDVLTLLDPTTDGLRADPARLRDLEAYLGAFEARRGVHPLLVGGR